MVGISVIGNQNFVLGFRLTGIRDTYIAENDEKLEENLQRLLVSKKSSIIVIQDVDYAKLTPATRRRANESIEPVIISVGKMDEENIREKIKKAIGIDLYKKEK
jgi:V/A-type H+-transporting ATPase subunit F